MASSAPPTPPGWEPGEWEPTERLAPRRVIGQQEFQIDFGAGADDDLPPLADQVLPPGGHGDDADDGPGVGRRAARAVATRVGDMFGAGGPAFRILANAHAASTAGDTLVAVALANTLFFSVPSSEARGNVVLYLLLTVAPFAVIGPVLGWIMDRRGAERATLIAASLLRLVVAVALIFLSTTIWLFPLAFALMVLSRVHGISRSALLPQALDNAIALVTANARLAQVGVLAGAIAAPVGAGLAAVSGSLSAQVVLAASAVLFGVAVQQSFLVPKVELSPDETLTGEWAGSRTRPLPLAASDAPMVATTTAPKRPLPPEVRLARLATSVVRLLNGFLVLLLAFAFRDVDAPLADFGAVLAAAGGGYALAAVAAPRLERALREEPMVVAALAVEAAAAFILKDFFGLPAAMFLALAAGYAWGTAKFAFDGLLQATVAEEARGRAFTNSETIFQLAWVVGGLIPSAMTLNTNLGLSLAGVTALLAQVIYVSRLLQRS